jgi:para-nitrobenzyl esterase
MLMKKYPLDRYASPSLAEIAMAQNAKACTARSLDRQWARHAPVYVYQFEDRSAPWYMQPMSYPMRAYHTSELQFLFPMFHGARGTPQPLSDAQQRLSDMMVDYWTAFARTGNPNSPGNPAWAAYSPDQDNLQVLDLPAPHAAAGYGAANDCAMWDEILPFK